MARRAATRASTTGAATARAAAAATAPVKANAVKAGQIKANPVKAGLFKAGSGKAGAAKAGSAGAAKTNARTSAGGMDRAPPKLDGQPLEKQVAMLLLERQTLIAALEASEARAAEVADRIAWALDTLEDLLGRGA